MVDGLLWFDNSEGFDLEKKLQKVMNHYEGKFGVRPNLVYVHPSMLIGGMPILTMIEIRATNTVLPNHFWIGMKNREQGTAFRNAA